MSNEQVATQKYVDDKSLALLENCGDVKPSHPQEGHVYVFKSGLVEVFTNGQWLPVVEE